MSDKRKHGKAVVGLNNLKVHIVSKKESPPKKENIFERKFEKVLVRTEEQKKKIRKARNLTDRKKGSLGDDLDYEVKIERAKIRELDTDASKIFVTLSCGYCGELVEGQGFGDLKDFVDRELRPLRNPWGMRHKGEPIHMNKTKSFERQCSHCGFTGIRGHIEVRIKDKAIERAKAERRKDERDVENFGGVVTFKEFAISGGRFPRDTTYLHKEVPAVLRYACGGCGREGFATDIQKLFKDLLKNVQNAWETAESIEAETVDVKFRCPKCMNGMRISGTIEVRFPEAQKELIQAFKLWQRDAHQLVFEKTKFTPSLDFEKAFYEARQKEREHK